MKNPYGIKGVAYIKNGQNRKWAYNWTTEDGKRKRVSFYTFDEAKEAALEHQASIGSPTPKTKFKYNTKPVKPQKLKVSVFCNLKSNGKYDISFRFTHPKSELRYAVRRFDFNYDDIRPWLDKYFNKKKMKVNFDIRWKRSTVK